MEEFAGRIRAAVEARTDPDLLIIARTDAIAVTGFDDAVGRAAAAARAGADVLFVEAPTSEAEIEALPRRLDRPLLFNYAPSGRSPLLPFARLRALGYAIVIVPVELLFVATRAMQRALAELRDRDATLAGSRAARVVPGVLRPDRSAGTARARAAVLTGRSRAARPRS